MAYSYNSNPTTQSGSGTYGSVAGATDLPDVYSELSSVYPNLTSSNSAASDAVLSELQGQLSNSTVNSIQDAAAKYGISSGMPGSGVSKNLSLKDIGLTSENLQSQGVSDYTKLLSGISNTQTVSPETQISLSQSNANLAAEANPTSAGSYAESLFDKYLSQVSSAGSSTSGSGGLTLRSNSGGGGTTSPFTITSGDAPTVSLNNASANAPTSNAQTGGYTPVTGNTGIAGWDSQVGDSITGGAGSTSTGDSYDWESLLSDYGL